MKKYRLVLFFLVALSLLNSATAEGGFYTGIGVGYNDVSNTVQSPLVFNSDNASGTQNGSGIASALYFGYDFNRYIGIQSEYDIGFPTQIANAYYANQQLFGLSVLAHLPFMLFSDLLSGLSVFAKGGIGYEVAALSGQSGCNNCVNPPNSASAFVPIYGLGIEYGTGNVGYRFEWDGVGSMMTANNGTNQTSISSNMFLLSILYHF